MEKIIVKFGDIEIKKQKFHQYKIKIQNFNKKYRNGFKYFIGHDAKKLRPVCIFLPKISAYRKEFCLVRYNEIWKKV